jgi:hypothetical protein
MTTNDWITMASVCGAGILLAIIVLFAHLPLALLVLPVAIVLFGIVANLEEMHAAWYGMLSTVGIFDPAALDDDEKAILARDRHYFWFGEVAAAAALAGLFTVPIGMILAEKSGSTLSFTIVAMIFLLLFVFLPKLISKAMSTDTDTLIQLIGKNEQVKKVFWSVFVILAGFVLAQVVDPAMAREILALITGMG